MENNNEIMNEEVIETAEEIVKTSSGNSFRKVAGIGLAIIAGGLASEFVVKPAVARFKAWRKTRQAKTVDCDNEGYFEEDIVDDSEE